MSAGENTQPEQGQDEAGPMQDATPDFRVHCFDDYQRWTRTTAVYTEPAYPLFGLVEEVGEMFGVLAKSARGDDISDAVARQRIVKEAGDVLWMLARALDDAGIAFTEITQGNIDKLESRAARNAIHGEGDDR